MSSFQAQAQVSFTPSFTGRNASKPYSESGIYDQDRVSSEGGVVVLADGHGMRGRDCAEFLAGHIREEMTRRLSLKSPKENVPLSVCFMKQTRIFAATFAPPFVP